MVVLVVLVVVVVGGVVMGVVMEVGPFASEEGGVVVVRLLWACVGLRWPSLAVVGCCGPSLTCVGRRWVLWACVGLRWPSLGAVGLC